MCAKKTVSNMPVRWPLTLIFAMSLVLFQVLPLSQAQAEPGPRAGQPPTTLSIDKETTLVEAYISRIEGVMDAFDEAQVVSLGCGLAGLAFGLLLVWWLAARFSTGQKWQALLVLVVALVGQQAGLHLAMNMAVESLQEKLAADEGIRGVRVTVVPLDQRPVFDNKVLAKMKRRAVSLGQRLVPKLQVFDRFNIVKQRYERGALWMYQSATAGGAVLAAFLFLVVGLHFAGRRGVI